jgi:hypothetical protein
MPRRHFNFISFIITFTIILFSHNAFSGFEIGAKGGFDSNIDRAVEDGRSDSFMTGFLSFTRLPGEGLDTGWSLNLSLEGTGYSDSGYLNYGMAGIKPAIIFYPHPKWRIDISPFINATKVNDDEQSAVAAGAELNMKQLPGQKFYTGEYFAYTDSRARDNIYSFKEKAFGAYAGVNWTDKFWSEIGYEYSNGDSFRAVGEIETTQTGTGLDGGTNQSGMGQAGRGQYGNGGSIRYSQAYNEYIINEPVDRQTIGLRTGCQFIRHIYLFINYAYTTYKGDSGTSNSHSGTIGAGYNF